MIASHRLNTPQTVNGNINFTNDVIINSDLSVTGDINGLDLQTDVVLTDVPQTITGKQHN